MLFKYTWLKLNDACGYTGLFEPCNFRWKIDVIDKPWQYVDYPITIYNQVIKHIKAV